MALTPQQQHAVDVYSHLLDGHNLAVLAGPGSGKTYILIHMACSCRRPLILTYNKSLQVDIQQQADASGHPDMAVFTIHAFISAQSGTVCHSDLALETAQVTRACDYSHVFIDEAQDLKVVFVDALRRAGVLDVPRLVIVGDAMQTLYDYDRDFPLEEGALTSPSECLKNEPFEVVHVSESHRCTGHMVGALNAITLPDPTVCTLRDLGARVNVATCRTPAEAASAMASYLLAWGDRSRRAILVSGVKKNFGLMRVLKTWSEGGSVGSLKFHVHPIDSAEPSTTTGKVRVSSFHASKGQTYDCVIVWIQSGTRVGRKALHVALSRASQQLLVVMSHDDLCPHVLRAASLHPRHFSVDAGTSAAISTHRTFVNAWTERADVDEGPRKDLIYMDDAREPIPVRAANCAVSARTLQPDLQEALAVTPLLTPPLEDSTRESVDDIFKLALLLKLEHDATEGRVAVVEDILQNNGRMVKREDARKLVIQCTQRRTSMQFITSSEKARIRELMRLSTKSAPVFCEMACHVLSTQGYQHRMKRLAPCVGKWCDEPLFDATSACAKGVLNTVFGHVRLEFDTRHVFVDSDGAAMTCFVQAFHRDSGRAAELITDDGAGCSERAARIFASSDLIKEVLFVNVLTGSVVCTECADVAHLRGLVR